MLKADTIEAESNYVNLFTDLHLETERVLIRPFATSDFSDLYAIVSQPEVMRYLPEGVMTEEGVKRVLSWITECYEKNTSQNIIKFTVAVVLKANSQLIGWVGLGPLEFDPSEIEIYYGIDKKYWGKGLATEAAAAMLDYGFRRIGLARIVAVANPENRASVRVIEKLRMRVEKSVRDLPPEHSDYEGLIQYSLKKKEFEAGTGDCPSY